MREQTALITFSHLRWNFVYQRPQHLLSRIARTRHVWFIEEPVFDGDSPPHWEQVNAGSNVTVLRPHTPAKTTGFSKEQIPYLRVLMGEFLLEKRIQRYDVWFYTPLAVPL